LEDLQNTSLYTKKKDLICSLIGMRPDDKQLNSFIIRYNGITLKLSTSNPQLEGDLRNEFPSSWFLDLKSNYDSHIIFYPPEHFNLSADEFEQEHSSDCITFSQGSFSCAIQRDFLAAQNEQHTLCIARPSLGDGFYNCMRWFLPKHMIHQNQLILHSSCVVGRNGKAYFFLGQSGAGKTTITSLSEERTILGDDMNILQVGASNIALPGGVGGQHFENIDYNRQWPVGGFFWIVQGANSSKSKLEKNQGMAKLLASMTNLFWNNSEKEIELKALELSELAMQNISMWELEFPKNSSFWELIDGSKGD
jgi:hypothetical protein